MLHILANDLSFTDEFTGHNAKSKEPRLNQIIDVPHFSKSHLAVLIQIADWVAFVVNQYLLLTVYEHPEKYPGELEKVAGWYARIGRALVSHTAIDPSGKGDLVTYYKSLRPKGWNVKKWYV